LIFFIYLFFFLESPHRQKDNFSPKKKASSSDVKGLSNIVNDLCLNLTNAPEDEGELENARALVQFSPKLPKGGVGSLVVELRRCYKDSSMQGGAFIVGKRERFFFFFFFF
jgi:hypothetical protein